LLGAKAIIVSRGGIGQPIDEIALNKALFDQEGVEVVGAIINKVEADKMEMIRKYTSLALKRLGIPLLGLLPSEKVLTSPNLEQIRERVNGTPLNRVDEIRPRRFSHIVIGAMTATGFLDTVSPDTLLITPGDREDIVLAALSHESHHTSGTISCIILTRDIRPSPELLERIGKSRIPFISVSTDSYTVASRIHSMTVKTQPGDDDKIPLIKKIIQENIDLNQIIDAFTPIED
jgi:BioD-like phosphotransacetylase family protein